MLCLTLYFSKCRWVHCTKLPWLETVFDPISARVALADKITNLSNLHPNWRAKLTILGAAGVDSCTEVDQSWLRLRINVTRHLELVKRWGADQFFILWYRGWGSSINILVASSDSPEIRTDIHSWPLPLREMEKSPISILCLGAIDWQAWQHGPWSYHSVIKCYIYIYI